MYKEKIINAQTGEESWRDYTPEEIAECEAAEIEASIKAEKIAQIQIKRAAALAKLEALGLDEDDLKALGL